MHFTVTLTVLKNIVCMSWTLLNQGSTAFTYNMSGYFASCILLFQKSKEKYKQGAKCSHVLFKPLK